MANVVTLYLDDTSLKLLVGGSGGIKKWAELPLGPGMLKDGVIIDEAAVASRVKELLKSQKVRARKVVTGLSGLHCLFRLITLPRLSKALLTEAVRREAERLLPVPLEQLYLSWQVMPGSGEGIRVFLAAFPRDSADALNRTLRRAGLNPYLIDLKPLALARAANTATAIVADVQPTELNIVVLVDRIPELIRTISLPEGGQTRRKKLSLVKEELDRTMTFYNSSHEERPLDPEAPIFISGEVVELPASISKELEEESEAGVTLAGKLKSFASPLTSPLKYPRGMSPSRYMVNIGLVLKVAPLPKTKAMSSLVNLNALPEVYLPKHRSLGEALFVPGMVILIALLVLPVMFVQEAAAETTLLQTQLDTTNQRYTARLIQKKAIAELKEKVGQLEAACGRFDEALNRFSQQQEEINGDLGEATSLLTISISLNKVTHSGDELTIIGVASDEVVILGYAESLRASDRFSQVIVSSIEKTEDEMKFKFTLIK